MCCARGHAGCMEQDKRNEEMIGYDNRMFFPVSLLNVFNIGLSKGGDNPDEA